MLTQASSALAIGFLALQASVSASETTYPTCESFGVDFQSGGTYFQNISSTDDFTFTSMFENCQDDNAYNILVDPNGDEYQCTDTPLVPDNTNQMSTCPISKDEMWSGPWSVLILSNNGKNADPIAYQREFSLIVGTPSTVTYTPTLTAVITSTPLSTSTLISTTATSATLTVSVTQPAKTKKPTSTITPAPVTSTKIWTMGVIRKTAFVISPVVVTKTITRTCSYSTQRFVDPPLTWRPKLLPQSLVQAFDQAIATATAAATATATAIPSQAPARRRDTAIVHRVPLDRAERIAARKARIAEADLDKRGIDQATTTVTDLNTADYTTITSTSLAAPSTVSITSVTTSTTTLTSTTTVLSGTTTLPASYITLPTPTRTVLRFTIITKTVATITGRPTYTVWQHTAPASATKSCTIRGGRMEG